MRKLKHGNIKDVDNILMTKLGHKIYNLWYGIWERGGLNKREKYLKYYADVTVCDEWIYLSNFISWLELQPRYEEFVNNLQLRWVIDKDAKKAGNRVYCPEYCTLMLASDNCREVLSRCGNPTPWSRLGTPKTPIIGISNFKIVLFKSQSDTKLLGFNIHNINSCLKKRLKTSQGYKWYYINYKHGKRLRKISS